jgi:beta-glucanase (GH16 family)
MLDEIDIELVGGDKEHWQTNVFAPSTEDRKPHYGKLSSVQNVPGAFPTIEEFHSYSIDWSPERIIWSVDGQAVRTLSVGARPFPNLVHTQAYSWTHRGHTNRR